MSRSSASNFSLNFASITWNCASIVSRKPEISPRSPDSSPTISDRTPPIAAVSVRVKLTEMIAIIPHVIKAGFVVAGSGGHGLVMARNADGKWSDPVFLNFGGGSVGFQAGVESTDVVLVFRERKSLDRLLEGKGKLTLGVDAGVAAGPVGRQAAAGTDAKLQTGILSYSRSRGLFVGVALDESVLNPDAHSNATFAADQRPETAKQVAVLKEVLDAMSATR